MGTKVAHIPPVFGKNVLSSRNFIAKQSESDWEATEKQEQNSPFSIEDPTQTLFPKSKTLNSKPLRIKGNKPRPKKFGYRPQSGNGNLLLLGRFLFIPALF